MADRYAVAPLLIPIARDLHVSLGQASAAASLYFVAYGLLPAAFGMLADRQGRVRIMRIALAGTAIGDLLSAMSPSLGFLLLARFVTGSFASGVMPTALVYVGDRVPFGIRQQAVSGVLTFVALGTAAGTLGSGITAHFFNWRVFFLIPGAVAAVVALLLGSVRESLTPATAQNPLRQVSSVLRNRWALFVLLLGLLVGAVMFGFVTFFAPSLEAGGQTAAVAGTVVASYGLSVLLCTRIFGRVARVVPAPLLLAGGALLLVAAYLSAALLQALPAILAASILAGGAYAFMQSTFQTWATDVVPQARATATALFATAIFTGAAAATAAVAGLATAHRYQLVFLIAAGTTLPVMLAGGLGRWRYRGSDMGEDAGRGSQIG